MSTFRQATKRTGAYNRTAHRLREIERIVNYRAGLVEDTDDADIILDQVACCLAHMMWKRGMRPQWADVLDRLNLWCERWAPEVSIVLRRNVAREVVRQPRLDQADECAARLRLSYAERTRLRITTIGAYDVDKRERLRRRKERKRTRDRERAARKRAAGSGMLRDEYLSKSLSATQPWKAMGISRRTWERRRRHTGQATPMRRINTATPSPSNLLLCWATNLRHGDDLSVIAGFVEPSD